MRMKQWMRVSIIVAACAVALTFAAEDKTPESSAGDVAWQELQRSFRPPPSPAEWRTNQPTPEQIAAFEKQNGVFAGLGADKAKEFYTKFPSHPKAKEAQSMELKLLAVAVQLGETNRQAGLEALEEKRLSDPTLPPEEKFNLRAQRIAKMVMDEETTNRLALLEKAEKATQELQQEFPKREEANDLWLMIAQGCLDADDIEKARAVTRLVAKNSSGEAKEQAEAQLRKYDRVGKVLDLKFKDLNGKEVDLKDYAGKVVLVDFWATWCGPCRASLPEVKETYAKLNSKGFEILAISFDKDKETLTKFVADEGLTWPQYFDGLGWENKLGQTFEISSIPTVWLVDKRGKLRDLNARESLASKVKKLLAEK